MIEASPTRVLAKKLGVSPDALYDAWKIGEGPPYYYVGNRRYVRHEEAFKWQLAREHRARKDKRPSGALSDSNPLLV